MTRPDGDNGNGGRGLTIVRAACPHDCPDTCAMLVTVEDGRAVEVAGDPAHPFTRGFLCTKVANYEQRTHSPDRVRTCCAARARRARGASSAISWDEALDEIAARFTALAESAEGAETILPYSYCGTMGLVQSQSWTGASSTASARRCSTARSARRRARPATGHRRRDASAPTPSASREARLILLWGTNTHHRERPPLAAGSGGQHSGRAPRRDRPAPHAHRRPVRRAHRPAARHGRRARARPDARHLRRRAGRPRLPRALHGRARRRCARALSEYPPARVAEICGLEAETIVRLAREYATTKPAVIRINYGLQRHAGGGMAVRTISCLPAVVGRVARPRGRRAALDERHVPARLRRARTARPDAHAEAAHAQHVAARRRC